MSGARAVAVPIGSVVRADDIVRNRWADAGLEREDDDEGHAAADQLLE